MRIDEQCVRENAALLGYLTHGAVRILTVAMPMSVGGPAAGELEEGGDGDGGGDGGGGEGRLRTAARATVRLLGREDTCEPVLFVDQPIYGHHTSTGANPAEDMAHQEALGRLLIHQAHSLGATLRVPVATWASCTAPPIDAAVATARAARADGSPSALTGVPSARAEAAARKGRVALIEYDGLAPMVYSNLRGRLVRGSGKAVAHPGMVPDAYDPQERRVLHALASITELVVPEPDDL